MQHLSMFSLLILLIQYKFVLKKKLHSEPIERTKVLWLTDNYRGNNRKMTTLFVFIVQIPLYNAYVTANP